MTFIKIIMKSGESFKVKCESYEVQYDELGQFSGLKFGGAVTGIPIFMDWSEVACVVENE